MRARQEPTWSQAPPYERTLSAEAAALAEVYFGEPLPWQRAQLDVMCALGADGKYAAKTVGKSVPRQNGKSWDVRARCNWGMLKFGERVLYTCQHGDTADEMFEAFASVYEDDEAFPELHKLTRKVVRTNGKQAVWLNNGGGIRFTTRTNSLGRGKTFDALVFDEAQDLTSAQQAALLPTVSAGRLANPQVIYLGTPPGPEVAGTVFRTLHDRVHEGLRPEVAWAEWAADEIGDTSDRARWYECNPSLGVLITEDAVRGEYEGMDADEFARERLGWWAPRSGGDEPPAIDPGVWGRTAIPAIARKYQGVSALGVKFSADGASWALAGCKLRRDRSRLAFELVAVGDTSRGTRELAELVAGKSGRVSAVLIDGAAAADALCANLAELGAPRGYVARAGTADVIAAAQGLVDGLTDGTSSHATRNQAALDSGAARAVRRPIGRSGGWGFEGSIEIEACALAVRCARTTRRDPTRKQRLL